MTETVKTPDAWTGAARCLLTSGLAGVTFALIEGPSYGRVVWLSGVAGLLLLVIAFFVEAHTRSSLVPIHLFRSREFTGANLLTFCLYAALGGALFYLPLNLIQIQGYTPAHAGAALLPMVLLMFLLSRWSGGLIARFGARAPLVIGPLIAATGYVLLARPDVGGSYWTTYFPAVMVLGLGMAVSVAPLTTVVMSSVAESRAGAASGVNNAVSQVASLLALAVLAPFFFHTFAMSLDRQLTNAPISAETRRSTMKQRDKLGAIETDDPYAQHAVDEAFVGGFRVVALLASSLAVAASASAAMTMKARSSTS